MKLLITAIVLVTILEPSTSKSSNSTVLKVNTADAVQTCVSQSNMPVNELHSSINAMKTGTLPKDRRVICYLACLVHESGMHTEEGHLDIEKANNWFPSHLKGTKDETIRKCDSEDNRKISDWCDRENDLLSCVLQEEATFFAEVDLTPN